MDGSVFEFTCPVKACTFSSNSRKQFLKHVSDFHPDVNFFICETCQNHPRVIFKSLKKIIHHLNNQHTSKVGKQQERSFSIAANTKLKVKASLSACEYRYKIYCMQPCCSFKTRNVSSFSAHTNTHGDSADDQSMETDALREKEYRGSDGLVQIEHSDSHNGVFSGDDEQMAVKTQGLVNSNDAGCKVHDSGNFNGSSECRDSQVKSSSFPGTNHCAFEFEETGHSRGVGSRSVPRHCPVCNAMRINLRQHMLIHSDFKLFQCIHCPFETYRNHDLKCHLQVHTQTKPFTCDLCRKNFLSSSDLKRHSLTHTPIKSFKCPTCTRAFRLKHHMKHHIKTQHRSLSQKC